VAAQLALAFAPNEKLRSSDLHTLLARVYGDSQPVFETQRPPDAAPSEPAVTAIDSSNLLGDRRAAWFERHRKELDRLLSELEHHRGNVSRAARAVGISRQRANRLLTAHAAFMGRAGQRRPS